MKIIEFLKNIINVILDGSLERVRIINALNQNFSETFNSGGLDRLCKVSISVGDPQFRHQLSSIWLRSGFKITIENDYGMIDSEIFEISDFVLHNKSFLRQLMSLGFDTLIVQGKITKRGKMFCMHKYGDLQGFVIDK